MDFIHADAGLLPLKCIFSHMLFNAVSILSGLHDGSWVSHIVVDIGLTCMGLRVVICCIDKIKSLSGECKSFGFSAAWRPTAGISVSFIPESPPRINSWILNGTFSLGSQDLIKLGCCLNSHINLLILLYSGTLLTSFLCL